MRALGLRWRPPLLTLWLHCYKDRMSKRDDEQRVGGPHLIKLLCRCQLVLIIAADNLIHRCATVHCPTGHLPRRIGCRRRLKPSLRIL